MTDRELFEKAAMVAGVPVYWREDGSMPNSWPWNPFVSAKDRLALARKFRLTIDYEFGEVVCPVTRMAHKSCADNSGDVYHFDIEDEISEGRAVMLAAIAESEEEKGVC